eukprot:1524871-Prymnesium_polylepis.1
MRRNHAPRSLPHASAQHRRVHAVGTSARSGPSSPRDCRRSVVGIVGERSRVAWPGGRARPG